VFVLVEVFPFFFLNITSSSSTSSSTAEFSGLVPSDSSVSEGSVTLLFTESGFTASTSRLS